jgi:hypothetical protein
MSLELRRFTTPAGGWQLATERSLGPLLSRDPVRQDCSPSCCEVRGARVGGRCGEKGGNRELLVGVSLGEHDRCLHVSSIDSPSRLTGWPMWNVKPPPSKRCGGGRCHRRPRRLSLQRPADSRLGHALLRAGAASRRSVIAFARDTSATRRAAPPHPDLPYGDQCKNRYSRRLPDSHVGRRNEANGRSRGAVPRSGNLQRLLLPRGGPED